MFLRTNKPDFENGGTKKSVFDLESGDIHPTKEGASPRPLQRSHSIPFTTNAAEISEEDDDEKDGFCLKNLHIDIKHIVDSLQSHIKFRVQEGYEMKGLPKFDDLTRYDICETDELALWKLEVHRLAKIAMSDELPTLDGDHEWFGKADLDGYNKLHCLAQQGLYALDVIVHDKELVLLEHAPDLVNEKAFRQVHDRIRHALDPEKRAMRYERSIRILKDNDQAYHALVNYFTAVLIRLLLRSMSGTFWVENCISVLAKFAAKLKVVGVDLPFAFERTLLQHRDFQTRLSLSQDIPIVVQQTQAASRGDDDDHVAKQQKALKQGHDTSAAEYFIELDVFRHHMSIMIRCAIADLTWNEQFGQTADLFETSAIIYDTGLPNRRTQLCQERDGSIGAGAQQRDIAFADLAFQIGLEIWNKLPSSCHTGENYTSLTWSQKPYLQGDNRKNQGTLSRGERPHGLVTLKLTAMADVITAMVPYHMFCGSFASMLCSFTKMVVLMSNSSNPVRYYPQKSFISVSRIHTSAYERYRNQITTPIAKSVFETDIAKRAYEGQPNTELESELEEAIQWTMDEKAIVIQHGWYSLISLSVCALLVAGGVLLIAVENRLPGVDPSNLTALLWAAAGFIMLYFKSRRAQDWPWRDFLQGRIVCRSVSEVQSVTGMDPQKLMAILLRLEGRIMLNTRGPFNTLFSRKAEDGFSIDVPLLTSTAVDGGHIFVRVESLSGPALVGLHATYRGSYESISPKDRVDDGEKHVCRDFLDAGMYRNHGEGEEKALRLYNLCLNALDWHRVQGIFSREALFD